MFLRSGQFYWSSDLDVFSPLFVFSTYFSAWSICFITKDGVATLFFEPFLSQLSWPLIADSASVPRNWKATQRIHALLGPSEPRVYFYFLFLCPIQWNQQRNLSPGWMNKQINKLKCKMQTIYLPKCIASLQMTKCGRPNTTRVTGPSKMRAVVLFCFALLLLDFGLIFWNGPKI